MCNEHDTNPLRVPDAIPGTRMEQDEEGQIQERSSDLQPCHFFRLSVFLLDDPLVVWCVPDVHGVRSER